jgi:hypothetical protein
MMILGMVYGIVLPTPFRSLDDSSSQRRAWVSSSRHKKRRSPPRRDFPWRRNQKNGVIKMRRKRSLPNQFIWCQKSQHFQPSAMSILSYKNWRLLVQPKHRGYDSS